MDIVQVLVIVLHSNLLFGFIIAHKYFLINYFDIKEDLSLDKFYHINYY